MKKVLEKLPKLLADGDRTRALRLLTGLHERLWRTPIGDFQNLLRRASMTDEVVKLAAEAVQGCVVCRKYVRLPARPQLKAHGATIFNEVVQFDLFTLRDTVYMILIDEATRFRTCSIPEGQEAGQLLQAMLKSWFQFFEPPSKLVLDQQSGLMGYSAAAEFERLGITRAPKGTTQGTSANQRTGTGLVERHVELIKLTIPNLKAELERQGLRPEAEELGQEAAMAHNITLNYGGVTPVMSVFGILPRGFYNPDSHGPMTTSGSLEKDVAVFERAIRIRQTALAQTNQAVIEDRVARANRTRPHQLDLSQMTVVPRKWNSTVKYKEILAGEVLLCCFDLTRKKEWR